MRIWDTDTGVLRSAYAKHGRRVNKVAFSPDGRNVVSASDDGIVKVWRVKVTEQSLSLRTGARQVLAMAFAPNGRTLVSATGDKKLNFWDLPDETPRKTGQAPLDSHVLCLAFNPSGRVLASAGYDRIVRLWDSSNGAPIRTLGENSGLREPVRSVVFSPDGKVLASASGDGRVLLWDLAPASSGRGPIHELRGHAGFINTVAFSPDGKTLASGGYDGTVRLWDSKTGNPGMTLGSEHDGQVLSVAFSPDGRRLAAATGEVRSPLTKRGQNAVRLWDVSTGHAEPPLLGHTGYVRRIAFSPDGQVLASASADRSVILWDPKIGYEQRKLEPSSADASSGDVLSLAFSADGQVLASGGADGTIAVWESSPTPVVNQAQVLSGLKDYTWALAASPDDETVRVAGRAGMLLTFEPFPTATQTTEFNHGPILAVAHAAPGKELLALGWADGTLGLVDTKTSGLKSSVRTGQGSIRQVAFAPDGRLLATAGTDGTIAVWGLSTRLDSASPRMILRGHHGYVNALVFGKDGQTLVSGGYDGTVRVWNVQTGKERSRYDDHLGGQVLDLALSPDGTRLASAGGRIRAPDRVTGADVVCVRSFPGDQPPMRLVGHSAPIRRLAFAPDGGSLATASLDGSLMTWEPGTGRAIARYEGHNGAVNDVHFSHKGDLLYSCGVDGTVRAWECLKPTAR